MQGGIFIKTEGGYKAIPGTGISDLTIDNLPDHYKMLDGGVTGTYQESGQFANGYEWFIGRDRRRAEFHQSQVDALIGAR